MPLELTPAGLTGEQHLHLSSLGGLRMMQDKDQSLAADLPQALTGQERRDAACALASKALSNTTFDYTFDGITVLRIPANIDLESATSDDDIIRRMLIGVMSSICAIHGLVRR